MSLQRTVVVAIGVPRGSRVELGSLGKIYAREKTDPHVCSFWCSGCDGMGPLPEPSRIACFVDRFGFGDLRSATSSWLHTFSLRFVPRVSTDVRYEAHRVVSPWRSYFFHCRHGDSI